MEATFNSDGIIISPQSLHQQIHGTAGASRYVGYPQMNSIFKHLTQVSGITCRFGDRVRPVLVCEVGGKSLIFCSLSLFEHIGND